MNTFLETLDVVYGYRSVWTSDAEIYCTKATNFSYTIFVVSRSFSFVLLKVRLESTYEGEIKEDLGKLCERFMIVRWPIN